MDGDREDADDISIDRTSMSMLLFIGSFASPSLSPSLLIIITQTNLYNNTQTRTKWLVVTFVDAR